MRPLAASCSAARERTSQVGLCLRRIVSDRTTDLSVLHGVRMLLNEIPDTSGAFCRRTAAPSDHDSRAGVGSPTKTPPAQAPDPDSRGTLQRLEGPDKIQRPRQSLRAWL